MGKKNTRKNSKVGPDRGLVPEEVDNINKEFYDEYPIDYFNTKLHILTGMISNPTEISTSFNNLKTIKVGVLELKPDENIIEESELEKFSKLELSNTYYHCIETFLRLFLAHISLTQSPWLEMARERDFRKFKTILSSLAKEEFKFQNAELSLDEMILYVFYGFKDVSHWEGSLTKSEAAEILKKWISWSAAQLLEVYDYNAFKHGLVVSSGDNGFTLGRQDDENKIEEKGQTLKYINKKEKPERWVWEKRVVFAPLDFRGFIIIMLTDLMRNLVKVGRFTYLQEEIGELVFYYNKDNIPMKHYEAVKTKNNFNVLVKGYSVELLYFKENNHHK